MKDSSHTLYDFDCVPDRTLRYETKHSAMQKLVQHLSISVPKDVIPLWIADMEYMVPTSLVSALVARAQHGIFGYTETPDDLSELVHTWLSKIHALEVDPANIFFSGSVLHSVFATIMGCTKEGDDVLIFQPVYGPLSSMVTQHNRNLVVHNLDQSGDVFSIDFDTLKSQITPRTTLLILCNPHNPSGRTWTTQELLQIAEICLSHNITICSNDTHNDVCYSDTRYTPLISLGKEIENITVTCMSIGKTFNVSGLHASHAVCTNPLLLRKVKTQLDKVWGNNILNVFSIEAYIALYTHGYNWYTQVISYLEQNRNFAFQYIKNNVPRVRPLVTQATYLMWLDCRAISEDEPTLQKLFIEDARVFLSNGSFFGAPGTGFMRLNFACPKSILEEALHRIEKTLG